jgi:hypothetical protein
MRTIRRMASHQRFRSSVASSEMIDAQIMQVRIRIFLIATNPSPKLRLHKPRETSGVYR